MRQNLERAQASQKHQADRHRHDLQLEVNNYYWLSTKNLKLQGISSKFQPKFVGPFKCLQVKGPSALLDLPANMKIHPWFHSNLLKPHVGELPEPVELAVEGEAEEFEVQRILDRRVARGKLEYLVQWKHFGAESNTWEPLSNLRNAQ